MNSRNLRFVTLSALMIVCPLLGGGREGQQRDEPRPKAVEVEGLAPAYATCALVNFSVKNVSSRGFYVEVYAERLLDGKWDNVDYPYDLNFPPSLYHKPIIVKPDVLMPGKSIPLTYDRCMKPNFVKRNTSDFRRAIAANDADAPNHVLERLRVDVYTVDHDVITFLEKDPSVPFERTHTSK